MAITVFRLSTSNMVKHTLWILIIFSSVTFAEDNEYTPANLSGLNRMYPYYALVHGWEGTVRLKVHISADGDIKDVIVASSSGHRFLDETAVDMIKDVHATPARRSDKPVDSWVMVPYRFILTNGEDYRYIPANLSDFNLIYPFEAKEQGWEGTVTLKVHISADGDIEDVIVVSSSGHEVLDEAAVDMIKDANATPARRGDKPVDSWVVLPYRFTLPK